ncbi:hypothetical protein Tco_0776252 [Tanacetum coccineum]
MQSISKWIQNNGWNEEYEESSMVNMDAFEEFKLVFTNLKRVHLPVKYLGVPLISTRLIYRDCRELIEKVQNRINDWKNKSLSVAGRLQLIKSVIGPMHIYWASVFILPSRILLDLDQSVREFFYGARAYDREGQGVLGFSVSSA